MAEKSFEIRTETHVATVGPHRFEFEPEVEGATFAGAYAELRAAQAALKAAGDNIGAEELAAVSAAMRMFVGRFMLEESRERFATIKLPDRVLTQMLSWSAELYGGGSGNDQNG